jgi:hypothetical protein
LIWGVTFVAAACVEAGDGDGEGPDREPQVRAFEVTQVINGTYGDGRDQYGLRIGDDGSFVGVSTFCVAGNGSVFVADSVKRRVLVYEAGGSPRGHIPYPKGWEVLRLAFCRNGLYVLAQRQKEEAMPQAGWFDSASLSTWYDGAEFLNHVRLSSNGEHPRGLGLLRWNDVDGLWGAVATPLAGAGLPHETAGGRSIGDRVWFQSYEGEICLYDPAVAKTFRLTFEGDALCPESLGLPCMNGWLLPFGATVLKQGKTTCLLTADNRAHALPWLEGCLVGADSLGALYVCEVEDDEPKPRVYIAVYDREGLLAARWILPSRSGPVRMLGPRVVVAAGGAVYEFWSSLQEFHILRWESSKKSCEVEETEDL